MKPFDENGAFCAPDGGGGGLRQLAVRGAGVTVFSGGIGLAIQIVGTVVLARLLTPKDFGLVTMVTTFSVLFVSFGSNGLTEAVVQRERMDHALASNLFWANLGAGLLLTIGFAAAGSLLARLYKEEAVKLVAIYTSITIILTSASVMHLALLRRAMCFSQVSFNEIRARAISVAVSIFLGWAGCGYWSLVAGAVALPISQTIGAWRLCEWVPSLPRRVAGSGSTVRFALRTYGRFGVSYFTANTDNLLVGRWFDAQTLGFYKKAYDLFALSANQLVHPLTIVVVSGLNRLKKDSAQYRGYLLGALSVMTFVGMGLAADLTLVGKDLIRVLLGPKWDSAAHIFTFFGPGIGVTILYYTHGWIHLSIGRPDRWLRWGIIEFCVTCLLFLLGLPWGPVGIAVAWTLSFWLLTIPALWYAGKPIGFGISPVLAMAWKYVVAALVAGSVTELLMRQVLFLAEPFGLGGTVARIMVTSAVLGVLYLSLIVFLHGGFKPLYQITGLMREMVPPSRFYGLAATGTASKVEFDHRKPEMKATFNETPL